MAGFIAGLFFLLAVVGSYYVGKGSAYIDAADTCNKYGAFYVSDVRYECKKAAQ